MSRMSQIIFGKNIFKVSLLIVVLLRSIPFFYPFASLFMKFLLIWGVVQIGVGFFKNPLLFKTRYGKLTILLLCLMGCSVMVNFNFNLVDNVKLWSYNAIALLLLFIFDDHTSSENPANFIFLMNKIVIIFTFAASLISVLMFFSWYQSAKTVGDLCFDIGVVNDRLCGVYFNAVDSAVMACLSSMATIFNLIFVRKKRLRYFYFANLVIQLIVIVASDSDGAMFAIIAALSMAFLLFWIPKHANKYKVMRSIFLSVAGCLAILILVPGTRIILKKTLVLIPTIISSQLSGTVDSNDLHIGDDFNRRYQSANLSDTNDITTGRLHLWKSAMILSKQNLIFGIGGHIKSVDGTLQNNIVSNQQNADAVKSIVHVNGSTHNIFVQLLLNYGLLVLIAFCLLGGVVAYDAIKSLIHMNINTQSYKMLAVAIIFSTYIVASNLFENYILGQRFEQLEMYVFWVYLGFIICFCNKEKIED